jgi:hypothetical protein
LLVVLSSAAVTACRRRAPQPVAVDASAEPPVILVPVVVPTAPATVAEQIDAAVAEPGGVTIRAGTLRIPYGAVEVFPPDAGPS